MVITPTLMVGEALALTWPRPHTMGPSYRRCTAISFFRSATPNAFAVCVMTASASVASAVPSLLAFVVAR